MKRLLIAILVFTAATVVVRAWRSAATQMRRQAAETRTMWMKQTQLVEQTRMQLTSAEERVRDLGRDLKALPQSDASTNSSSLLALTNSNRLSAAQREQLLTELGFNWNNTGDYLMVSKATLRNVSVDGLRGGKLSDTACDLLAITPDERSRIEAQLQGLVAEYQAWAAAHLQREEPAGDVLAKYTLTADPDFSSSLSNRFCSGIMATLGNQRGSLLLAYAGSWMIERGMLGSGATLTVTRPPPGDQSRLGYSVKDANSTMSSSVTPHQPFPEAFSPAFPNGWPDLAVREGFELPKEFRK